MTYEEAARILDPETSREALLPYAYDQQYQQMLLRDACRLAAEMLRNDSNANIVNSGNDRMGMSNMQVFCNGKKDFCDNNELCKECDFFDGSGDIGTDVIDNALSALFGKNYNLDRLKELANADREGRCTIFPCRDWLDLVFGEQEIFYGIDMDYMENPIREITVENESRFTWYGGWKSLVFCGVDENGLYWEFSPEDIGKTVFLTEEQAESTLEKMKERADNETD